MPNPFDSMSTDQIQKLLRGDSLTFEEQLAIATAPRTSSSSSSNSTTSSQDPKQFAENMKLLRDQLQESKLGREQKTAIDSYLAQLQARRDVIADLNEKQKQLIEIAGQREQGRQADNSRRESARQANLKAAVDQYQTALSLIPQLGNLAIEESKQVSNILQNGGDFLSRAFESRGGTSPLARVSQADQINAVTSVLDRVRQQINDALKGGPPDLNGGQFDQGSYQPPATVGGFGSVPDMPQLTIPKEQAPAPSQEVAPVAAQGGGGFGGAMTAPTAPTIDRGVAGPMIDSPQPPSGFGGVSPVDYGVPLPANYRPPAESPWSSLNSFEGAGKVVGAAPAAFLSGQDNLSRGFNRAAGAVGSAASSFLGGLKKGFLGYAEGGMTREPMFMVGDHPSGMPTGTEEMIVNPTNAPIKVIPNPQTQQMMSGFSRYAEGTEPSGYALSQYLQQMRGAGREAEAVALLQSRGYSQASPPSAPTVSQQTYPGVDRQVAPSAQQTQMPEVNGARQQFSPEVTPYLPDPNSRYDPTTRTMYQTTPQGRPVPEMGPQAAPASAARPVQTPAAILNATTSLQGDALVSYLRSLTPEEYSQWTASRERAAAGEPIANTVAAGVAGLLGAGVAGVARALAATGGRGESIASKLGEIGPDTVRSLLNNAGVRASYIARRLGQIGPDTIRSIPGYAMGTGGFSRYATGTDPYTTGQNLASAYNSGDIGGFRAAGGTAVDTRTDPVPFGGGLTGLRAPTGATYQGTPIDPRFVGVNGQGNYYSAGGQTVMANQLDSATGWRPQPKFTTQAELVDIARRSSPPALQALFNNTPVPAQTALKSTVPGEDVYLKTPTARQWMALTPEERKAAEARYNVEFNAGAGFVPNRIASQYGSTGSRQRGFVGAMGV